jgi:hypothetical protein
MAKPRPLSLTRLPATILRFVHKVRKLGDIGRAPPRLVAGEPASLYSADVQIREPQMTWGARASDQEFVK